MTIEELEKLNAIQNRIADIKTGYGSIAELNWILERCQEHITHGTENITIALGFCNRKIEYPGEYLIEYLKNTIESRQKWMEELQAEFEAYKLITEDNDSIH